MTVFQKSIIVLITLSLAALIIPSCSDGTVVYSELDYYREGQLKNTFRNEIAPLHALFAGECAKLSNVSITFTNQPNEENLIKLRKQWLETILVWKRCELYNQGPVEQSFIHNSIDKWPVNATTIETAINGEDIIDKSYIASRGSNAKGLAAIEYLIFNQEKNTSEVLNDFSNSRRLDYLSSLSENLVEVSESTNSMWTGYQNEFETQAGGGLEGGQNKLINNLINLLEEIVQTKVGKVLGNSNGGTPMPSLAEGYNSAASLQMIKANLKTIERCYTGEFSQAPFRVGFDEFLIQSESIALNERILNQIQSCYESIDKIQNELGSAVISENQQVVALYDTFGELLILLKVDLANVLGSTITFTDNDGD